MTEGEKLNCLRYDLQRHQEKTGLSLRKIGDATGISFSTLSRFGRGAEMTHANTLRLYSYLSGEPQPKPQPIHTRRLRVAGKTFLVSIELLED